MASLGDRIDRKPEQVVREVMDFLKGRLALAITTFPAKLAITTFPAKVEGTTAGSTLIEEGIIRPDVVAAVLAADFSDVHDTLERARALDALRRTDGFDDLMTGFKRVMKIIPDDLDPEPVAPERLASGPERALWDAFERARAAIEDRSLSAKDRLAAMAAMRPQVDAFFDAVLVMDPDPGIRRHRLSMLARIRDTFRTFADFGQVAVG